MLLRPGACVNGHLLPRRVRVRLSKEGLFYLFDSGFFEFVTPFFLSVTLSAWRWNFLPSRKG